jgi:hypothetical protein
MHGVVITNFPLKFPSHFLQYSYELLLRHLHEEKAFVMLEMINKGTVFEGMMPK